MRERMTRGRCAAACVAVATALTLIFGNIYARVGAEGLDSADSAVEAAAADDGAIVVVSQDEAAGSDSQEQAQAQDGADSQQGAAADGHQDAAADGKTPDASAPNTRAKPKEIGLQYSAVHGGMRNTSCCPLSFFAEDGSLDEGFYLVDEDLTIAQPIEISSNVTLVLEKSLTFELEGCLLVRSGATLTITRRSTVEGRATLKGHDANAVVYNEGDTRILDTDFEGGDTQSLVNNYKGAHLLLRNSSVSGCSRDAVTNSEGGNLTLQDTSITGNGGFGVACAGAMGVSGKVVVTDNAKGNLGLEDKPLYIDAPLAAGASMGVTLSCGNGTFTKGLAKNAADVAPSDCFFSDAGKCVCRDADGEAALVDGLSYINEKGRPAAVDSAEVTDLANSTNGWIPMPSGWYTFSHSVTWEGRGSVEGDVKMIVPDGVSVDWRYGIHVAPGSSLTIFGQKDGSGELHAYRADNDTEDAGIGGNAGEAPGPITICGARVTAEGSEDAAGIGGGGDKGHDAGGSGGTITIYGGTVKATGYDCGAGIGGGYKGDGGTISIHGGNVEALADPGDMGNSGAGIGGGVEGGSGSITITGGSVNATSGRNGNGHSGAGIGGGCDGDNEAGVIAISGGMVTAVTDEGAAVGGGYGHGSGVIEISGGTITATAKGGAGIGAGESCEKAYHVSIENAEVHASSTDGGAGIGLGKSYADDKKASTGEVRIRNARVTARSVGGGAGIGGCYKFSGGMVTIQGDSMVDAQSDSGAAIGRGGNGDKAYVGDVRLDNQLKVICYDEGGKLAPAAERAAYCLYRNHVKVETCEHPTYSYEQHGSSHIARCNSCPKSFEEGHDFGGGDTCEKCHFENKPAFAPCSWDCGEKIHLAFPIEVPQDCAERFATGYVRLGIGGKTGRRIKVALSDMKTDDQGRKVASMDLSTLEMAEPVTADLCYGNGRKISTTMSLRDCLERDAKQGNDEAKALLARTTANLGHCMQRFLEQSGAWTIGVEYEDMDLFFEDALKVEDAGAELASYKAKRSTKGTAVKGLGMDVAFGASTTVCLYVAPKAGADFAAKVTFDGRDVELTKCRDGRWMARVEGVSARDLDKVLRIEGDCGGKFSVEASALSYAANTFAADGATDATKAAMVALLRYHKAATAM